MIRSYWDDGTGIESTSVAMRKLQGEEINEQIIIVQRRSKGSVSRHEQSNHVRTVKLRGLAGTKKLRLSHRLGVPTSPSPIPPFARGIIISVVFAGSLVGARGGDERRLALEFLLRVLNHHRLVQLVVKVDALQLDTWYSEFSGIVGFGDVVGRSRVFRLIFSGLGVRSSDLYKEPVG